MKESEILAGAIEGLETSGWVKTRMYGHQGGMCAMGAIYYGGGRTEWITLSSGRRALQLKGPKAFAGDSDIQVRISAIERLKRAAGIARQNELTVWNDRPERTEDEVLTAFRHALKLALEDESEEARG